MHDQPGIREDLTRLGLMNNGTWVPDLRNVVSAGHLQDLESVTAQEYLATRVELFTASIATEFVQDLCVRVIALLNLTGAERNICICETMARERECCLQFASGLSLVFVHADSMRAPYAGFLHEVLHAFGLTGIAEIDEGIAMLFESAAKAGAVSWVPEITFEPEWCAELARRQVSTADVYSFGASYFAALLEEDGINDLWPERLKLRDLGEARAIQDHMRMRMIRVRAGDVVLPDGPITAKRLDELYFAGELTQFKAESIAFFDGVDPEKLSLPEQLTFGRALIYLATLEDEEIPEVYLLILTKGVAAEVAPSVARLIEVARSIFATRRSQSRIALKKNARKMKRLLIATQDTPEIRADILLQLVLFHKYVPEIAGGDRSKIPDYAEELSFVPGMAAVGQRLVQTSQR